MEKIKLKQKISEYYSNNGIRISTVYKNSDYTYEVVVIEKEKILYEGKYNSEEMAEHVAEEWVLTYYKGDLTWRQKE